MLSFSFRQETLFQSCVAQVSPHATKTKKNPPHTWLKGLVPTYLTAPLRGTHEFDPSELLNRRPGQNYLLHITAVGTLWRCHVADDAPLVSAAVELLCGASCRSAFLHARSLSFSPRRCRTAGPELSTLLHTAGIRPINRQTTSCNARRRLTLHDWRVEGYATYFGKKKKSTDCLLVFVFCFFSSNEGRPETKRSGARVGRRKILHRVSEAKKDPLQFY